jgi:D-glycero-D-manno-heptose 1,7-bisphosphate phosphatase
MNAVFLDRDGVLTLPVLNPKTKQYEAPFSEAEVKIYPESFEALKKLQKKFSLFIVSNQPDYALGKATLEGIKSAGRKFADELKNNGVKIKDFFYCYHHPKGTTPGYGIHCECRKPSSFFLKKAARDHNIDLKMSWMIGDRDTDIECGKNVGCKTILITNPLSKEKQGKESPTFTASDVDKAADIILKGKSK